MIHVWGMRPGGLVLALLVATSAGAQAPDPAPGLRGLPRVALEIVLAPDLVDLEDEIEQRVERALGEMPAPAVDRNSAQKLRLVVGVRAQNASDLRGFWLPFSGTYAVGHVRLEVVRGLTLPGPTPAAATMVPAIVWQRDRLVARPWRQAQAEIVAALDELIGAFLADYRRAR